MPTMDELARDFANRLAGSRNPTAVAQQIETEIRFLRYQANQRPLTLEDRTILLQKTYDLLSNFPTFTKSADNNHYLQLIQWILSQGSK